MPERLSSRTKIEIALFTVIRTAINSGYRMIYPLLPMFATGMGVQLSDLSIAFSIRSIQGVFSPFIAALADARGRKNGMLLGMALFFLGCGITAVWQDFTSFVVGTAVLSIGNGIFIPSMQSYLSDHVPYERRGTVLSITELSWSLGFILGVPLLGSLLVNHNWVAPYFALTITGLILLIALWKIVPSETPDRAQAQPLLQNLHKSLSYFPVLAGAAVGVLFTGANEMINLVFAVWIKDSFGLEFATMAIASIVIGSSELVSELLSAFVLDKIGKQRAIIISLILNSLSAILLPLAVHSLTLALLGLALFYITFEFALISLMTNMSEVFPSARATVMAVTISTFSLGRLIGSLFGTDLYQISFWAVCLATVALNSLALIFVRHIRIELQSVPTKQLK
ncbi:MAG: MFS transporter [Anaerolineaceae bacterium]